MCGMRKKATVEEAGQMSGKPNPASRFDRQHTITRSNLMRASWRSRRRRQGRCRASCGGGASKFVAIALGNDTTVSVLMRARRKLAIAEEKTGAMSSELRREFAAVEEHGSTSEAIAGAISELEARANDIVCSNPRVMQEYKCGSFFHVHVSACVQPAD